MTGRNHSRIIVVSSDIASPEFILNRIVSDINPVGFEFSDRGHVGQNCLLRVAPTFGSDTLGHENFVFLL